MIKMVHIEDDGEPHMIIEELDIDSLDDLHGLVGDLMEKAFDGSGAQLALRALSHKRASKEELDEVRELLDRLEGERRKQ